MDIVRDHPDIEQVLETWRAEIRETFEGYRGHVYRVFNCGLALRNCSEQEVRKLAIAAAFHDLGLWSDRTVDYIPPSVVRVREWLEANERVEWSEEIALMIEFHHKIRPYRDPEYPMVELFRKADLVDFSLGIVRFGLPSEFISRLKSEIPNAGFHRFLLRGARDWFLEHPLRPPPFFKW